MRKRYFLCITASLFLVSCGSTQLEVGDNDTSILKLEGDLSKVQQDLRSREKCLGVSHL